MNINSQSGFTLIEVVIAMVVTLIIMVGAYSAFNSQQKSTVVQTNVSDAQQSLRAAIDFMSRDIRMAGYDPEQSSNFGIVDVGFRDYDNNLAADGTSSIIFSWDQNENGVADGGEIVSYSLSNNSTVAPGSVALMYGTPARQPLTGYIVNLGLAYAIDADGNGKLDQYGGQVMWAIDADNDNDWDNLAVDQAAGTAVVTDTGIPVNESDIRAVRIWMLSRSEAPDPNFTDTNTYVIGREVVQPNNNYRHRMAERIVLCRNMGLSL